MVLEQREAIYLAGREKCGAGVGSRGKVSVGRSIAGTRSEEFTGLFSQDYIIRLTSGFPVDGTQ